jgi:hypothetical protein
MGGTAGVAGSQGSQPMSTAVHAGAQINFGDLTPYLSYGSTCHIGNMEDFGDGCKGFLFIINPEDRITRCITGSPLNSLPTPPIHLTLQSSLLFRVSHLKLIRSPPFELKPRHYCTSKTYFNLHCNTEIFLVITLLIFFLFLTGKK